MENEEMEGKGPFLRTYRQKRRQPLLLSRGPTQSKQAGNVTFTKTQPGNTLDFRVSQKPN